jgi:DNA-binding FadR family transcriptional regulator
MDRNWSDHLTTRRALPVPLQAIEPRRLYRQIAEQVRALILGGEYPVGQRLPPERDLAAQLGVSRPSVREALIALEVEGLVEVRPGAGIFVVARESPASARGVDSAFGPFEIIRARQVLEGELAALAAQNMDAAAIAGLHEAVALMEEDVARSEVPLRGDRLFHLRIAEAADNGPLLRAVTELFDERNNPLFEQLGQHFENASSWRQAMDEHRAVIAAIAAHQPGAARRAMQAHLQRSHDRFADAWPAAEAAAAEAR